MGPEAYARLKAAAGGTDAGVEAASDALVAQYADRAHQYDAQRRVTEVVASGEGCSSCAGGQGTFAYSYSASSNPAGYNSWSARTVETLPDGNTNTVYTNAYGQVMLAVYEDTASGQEWRRFYRYDAAGRLVLQAGPSAVTGHGESYADLVNYQNGNAQYLSDATGLVEAWTYYSSTTATESTAGGAAGFQQSYALRRGETGSDVEQEEWSYFRRTAGGSTVTPLATHTAYRNTNGTGAQVTSYAYTWHSGATQAESVTVTHPTVTTAQNGPGTADSETTVFDSFGRPVWEKDGGGFLHYTAYDVATGAVVKSITDVDTAQTQDFSGLPSGWSTPSGGGLHLVSSYEVDALGRVTRETDAGGSVTYTVYDDPGHEVRVYAGWDEVNDRPTGPTRVSRQDGAGGYTETLTMSAAPAVDGSGRPTGQEAIGSLEGLSRTAVNDAGQVVSEDVYFNLSGLSYSAATLTLGTENTNYYRTEYGYDSRGRRARTETPTGTIYRTVFDGQGRAVSEWVGLDDEPTSGSWSPSNTAGTDLVKVRESEYDGGGVGDGNLTRSTEHPGLGAAARVTETWYDWRNRAVAVKQGVEATEGTAVNRPLTYAEYDNLGQVIASESYDGDAVTVSDGNGDGVPDKPSASLLRARSTTEYDERGRVFRSHTFSVDPSTGSVSTDSLATDTWYDRRGQAVKVSSPGGLVQKTAYDGAGRATATYTTDGGGDSSWSDALAVTGDIVLEQAETGYDAGGNAILVVTRQRFHDETGTGALGDPSTAPKARVSYRAMYYDAGDRLTATVDVGTNGGSAWTRPGTVPARSDTALVTSWDYNSAGLAETVTDPRGIVARTEYDDLGRVVKSIEHYTDGTVTDSSNKTVETTYAGPGLRKTLTARLTGGGGQTTEWVYGVTTAGGSGLNSNEVVGAVRHPDPSTGAASSSEQETMTVNALGQTVTSTDRNGTVHTYAFDVLGRQVSDAVTTLGTGIDGAVRRVETAFDGQGNAYLLTSYDAASGGNVVNQVQREFNGLGQMTKEYQEHAGAVNTGTSPKVQYTFSAMSGGANHSRPTRMTYPSGYQLDFNYGVGLDDAVSRLSSLSDAGGTLEGYDYLGLGVVVRRSHPQPGVDLTYVKLSGESNGDAGDPYTGLDRFGRVVDQRWVDGSTGTALDRFRYGYDRNGNRLWRDNLVNGAFGELYAYDDLGQLTSFQRGTLNASRDGISGTPSRSQSWDHDALGNFDSVTTDGIGQSRSHNKQNEVTSVSGATAPTFDAAGNLTGDEAGRTFAYDAWGRVVKVNGAARYAYDALNRRVAEGSRALYYTADWQLVEERESGVAVARLVWSPVYVDALVLRDRDADANGSLEERLYALQDGNWNVTALVSAAGQVQERNAYDPFGLRTVLSASWGVLGSSGYAWVYLFQGGRLDAATGMYHFRNRDLSAALMRWNRLDPIHFTAGDPNLYRFVSNNPTGLYDPFGLKSPDVTIKEVKAPAFGRWGGMIWPVNFKLSQPADKKCGGWILQWVQRDVDITERRPGSNDERKYTGPGSERWNYWEAWRVEPGEDSPRESILNEALLRSVAPYDDDLRKAMRGEKANDWFMLRGLTTATNPRMSAGEARYHGKVYFLDKMKEADLPTYFVAGKIRPAGGLRAAGHQEYGTRIKELLKDYQASGPVIHQIHWTWKWKENSSEIVKDGKIPK